MDNPVIYIIIAIAVIGNIFLIIKLVKVILTYTSSQNWMPVEGILESSDYQKVVKSDESGAATWESYEVFLKYRYKAKGSIYTHDVMKKVANKEQAQAFKQGDILNFYFEPDKPENAQDEKGNLLDIVGIVGALVVFNLFAAGITYQIYQFFSTEM